MQQEFLAYIDNRLLIQFIQYRKLLQYTLETRQNGILFADGTYKWVF